MRKITPGRDLKEHYGITLTERQRRRLEAQGLFPRRVKISARSHGYFNDEVEAFIAVKAAERVAA